jgi:hypothetical protein
MGGAYTKIETCGQVPGGGIARRPLPVINPADCPGSMTGKKIQAPVRFIGSPGVSPRWPTTPTGWPER